MNDWKTTVKKMHRHHQAYRKIAERVQRIVPEMIPFYKGINSDYKNWNRNSSD